jgi:hypothetical protein
MNERMQKIKVKTIEEEQLDGELPNYVRVEHKEIETYSFFLRFIKQKFTPCNACQPTLKTVLFESDINWHPARMSVALYQQIVDGVRTFTFGLEFVSNGLSIFEWKPCKSCQKEIADILDSANNLFIGNEEYMPPVELSMKYELDEQSWRDIEKRLATLEEKERLKKNWWV